MGHSESHSSSVFSLIYITLQSFSNPTCHLLFNPFYKTQCNTYVTPRKRSLLSETNKSTEFNTPSEPSNTLQTIAHSCLQRISSRSIRDSQLLKRIFELTLLASRIISLLTLIPSFLVVLGISVFKIKLPTKTKQTQ